MTRRRASGIIGIHCILFTSLYLLVLLRICSFSFLLHTLKDHKVLIIRILESNSVNYLIKGCLRGWFWGYTYRWGFSGFPKSLVNTQYDHKGDVVALDTIHSSILRIRLHVSYYLPVWRTSFGVALQINIACSLKAIRNEPESKKKQGANE